MIFVQGFFDFCPIQMMGLCLMNSGSMTLLYIFLVVGYSWRPSPSKTGKSGTSITSYQNISKYSCVNADAPIF